MPPTDDQAHDHKFTIESLQLAFQQFANIAAHIDDADVERSREAISRADSIGFVIDPTAYRDALYSGSLDRQRKLVDLFTKTKAALRELFPEGWPKRE